jgi:hypothetical protein
VNVISDVDVSSLYQLTMRFELGADALPDQLVSSIERAVGVGRFQAGLNRAATFVSELQDEVTRRLRNDLEPAPAPEWLMQHASAFGLHQPNIIELLNAQAARWNNELPARIRAGLAAELFLSEEAVAEGRLALLAANSRDWRVSSVEYHNPLVIEIIGSAGVLGAANWVLVIVRKVQDTLLKSVELKKARLDLDRVKADGEAAKWRAEQVRWEANRLTWTAEKERLETVKLASQTDKTQREKRTDLARLTSQVNRPEAQMTQQVITSAAKSSSPGEFADHQREAVLARLVEKDESTSSGQAYQTVVQATVNVDFKTTVPADLAAVVEQADSLAELPHITEVDLRPSLYGYRTCLGPEHDRPTDPSRQAPRLSISAAKLPGQDKFKAMVPEMTIRYHWFHATDGR